MHKERDTIGFKERIKDLFDMHREERRGVLVLVAFLLALTSWVVYEQWLRPPKRYHLAQQRERMDAWVALRTQVQGDRAPMKLFPFDPNSIAREEWKALGLTDKQVDGIERYQKKGGQFRTKKDLGRMYSIKPEQFAALEPFILLPDSLARRTYADRKYEPRQGQQRAFEERSPTIRERAVYEPKPSRSVEINSADTTALIELPGIGPAFARSIVKFRDALGGFHSLDQLSEVYILKDKPDAVLKLKQLLLLDTLAVHRIPINTCTVEELAAHPYARWKVAKPLIAYRGQHGPFKQVAHIKGCAAISEEVFRKLAPYLSVE
ncbi:MAG: helix-hairpin-helix domain-containing protein [Flavobacteriales bacterium]|nr:helix-hairpin-helix domain-containing protein [Flavobacteriales bacterium]